MHLRLNHLSSKLERMQRNEGGLSIIAPLKICAIGFATPLPSTAIHTPIATMQKEIHLGACYVRRTASAWLVHVQPVAQ